MERKCTEVPELKEKIKAGKISVTKARRVSSVLTPENAYEWLQKAEELPKQELEKSIAAVQPEEVRESVRVIDSNRYALKLGISEELLQKLRRIQTLLSNKRKTAVSLEDVLEFNAEETLKRIDPLLKANRAHKKSSEQTSEKSSEKSPEKLPAETGHTVSSPDVETEEMGPGQVENAKVEPSDKSSQGGIVTIERTHSEGSGDDISGKV